MLEYDPINSFHIHANFFNYFPTGTSLTPVEFTDTVVQGQAQRGILELRVPLRRRVHVPRPQDRVRRARLDGLLRGRRRRRSPPPAGGLPLGFAKPRRRASDGGRRAHRAGGGGVPLWALVAGAAGADRGRDRDLRRCSAAPGSASARGPPVEELAVERTVLRPGEIELTVRNTGPDPVQVAQVSVADAYVDFTADPDGEIGRLDERDADARLPLAGGLRPTRSRC